MYWNAHFCIAARYLFGLIETWDVLKWNGISLIFVQELRLKETWDVLKLENGALGVPGAHGIKRNMGCIEIVLWLLRIPPRQD